MGSARVAGPGELETVTKIITRSFAEDPVWGPAFAGARGSDARMALWRAYLDAAMRFPWTWLSSGSEATAVWWDGFVALLDEHLGAGEASRAVTLFERFDRARPYGTAHYYLTLLGTHPDHRGAGHGMRLLAANLELIDQQGLPAYLESTNPANNDRYGRVGFEVIGSFEGYVPGSTITTMWRPGRR